MGAPMANYAKTYPFRRCGVLSADGVIPPTGWNKLIDMGCNVPALVIYCG
jgi:hypothetical protein